MASDELDRGEIAFQTEGRLLQELGLRLVAKPEVALVELIKNAYDADSPHCAVSLSGNDQILTIHDGGQGMTIADFKTKWMRIATASKATTAVSPKFHRRLTGAKGIGRFAVRYLGDHLTLESTAFDPKHKCLTCLKAVFDWPKLDNAPDISKAGVSYSLTRAPKGASTGTTLTVRKLRTSADFTKEKKLRDEVLKIVTPMQGLDRGRFTRTAEGGEKDPGFNVTLPGEDDQTNIDLARTVLDNYWARLTVDLTKQKLTYRVWLPEAKTPRELSVPFPNEISKGLFADIRYFPRRKGVFQDKGFNGLEAWAWVRENCGAKIVDHGFNIRPYGFPNDDWLRLDHDSAHNARDWRTKIAAKYFPIPPNIRADPAENPVLNLPYSRQIVGAVFVSSLRHTKGSDETDLLPAMDREGMLENAAFEQVFEAIRGGIEFLAHEDKAEMSRRERAEAAEAARTAREEIRHAIQFIEKSPTLKQTDKVRIVKQYRHLADRVDETEEYSATARKSLLTMGLLGVVAGFMTHESKAMVHDLEQAVQQVKELAKKQSSLDPIATKLSERLENFKGYLSYSQGFIRKVGAPEGETLRARAQVTRLMKQFHPFAADRGITVENEIDADLLTPKLPVAVYSGVILNLYTNALKAVLAAQTSQEKRTICFRAWNERDRHVVEVMDNGVGIPPEVRRRIWEPLYTTTSDDRTLGSGMGLGLTLVKQIVDEFKGTISLLPEPPPGFTTCFRVSFPKTSSQG